MTTAASVLIGFLYLKCKGVPFFGDYLLKILLGMALVMLMLVVDSLLSLGSRLNAILGSISYEVYLVHGTVFSLVSEITGGSRRGHSSRSRLREPFWSHGSFTGLGSLLCPLFAFHLTERGTGGRDLMSLTSICLYSVPCGDSFAIGGVL